MNKAKLLSLCVLALSGVLPAFAGGILTNTNQSAHFIRMVARDASLQIDAAYTNPAGLVKLEDGFHFSFTNQSAFQTRTITSTFAPFAGFGDNATKKFKGTASAPIIPSLQAAYKTGKWVLSGNIAVTGGGGKATFNDGLPSFESMIATMPLAISAMGVPTDKYSVDAYMRGSSFIYGAQLGGSYAINDMFSAYAGFRLNIVNNGYEGYLKNIKINPKHPLVNPTGGMMLATDFLTAAGKPEMAALVADREIDNKQSGWGVAPILGLNFNYKALNIGMKYEFKTSLNVESKTVDGKDAGLAQFKDGVNTPHDIPALFTVGASYQITPQLLASVGYHHFFDSDADMADDKQKFINGGTNEYLAGLEFRVNKMFLISAGGQITRYGVTDDYQKDLSFSINSYSIGLGGAVNVAKNVMINIGYFWTTYSDWTKENSKYAAVVGSNPPVYISGKDVFSRTNKVFAAGVDFSF
ncbi:OmpP1/FadL family transporter [Dysgonomonas sp. BGC7]|uniref:OmpP1/FadL family transporter n=1 Tax=Dysgonomonas sp. BGC7 TaxID=1658008 RepID=UPI00067F9BC7|nr:aromatic hydrocarbon degradation protein [Dysgonomonas sp. BGC7]MBD8387837.1 aromatic hydrocarbon degradation protein [Dysgonomonas sp. BGC7]